MTIAEWVAVTRRILADAVLLRPYVDQYLGDDLAVETEDQMISGSGSGENLLGILNTPGIGTAGPPGAMESMLYSLRKGLREVRVNGRTRATAAVKNPANAAAMDLLEKNGESNNFVFGPGITAPERSLWTVPIVESEAVPEGTALVGDFSKAVLFDREALTIAVGTVNDDFIRNIVRLLGEVRVGFGVLRPSAFCEVDLAA